MSGTAYASTTSDVVVTIPSAPLARCPVLVGDASNPLTWTIVDPSGNVIPVIQVTLGNPTTTVTLKVNPQLPGAGVTLSLTAPGLLDSTGAALAFGTATFKGVTEDALTALELLAATKTQESRDLLNRNTPSPSGSLTGTLVVQGGDYQNELGSSLLRKLIIRRLITRPADFYHLPNYGVGLRTKQPLPAGDLVRLQASIKQQIMQEPDVTDVGVQVSQSQNVLNIQLTVTVAKTGEKLSIGVPFQFGGGS